MFNLIRYMKKFLLLLVVAVVALFVSDYTAYARSVSIPLSQIHTDAAMRQYKRASAPNQRESVNEFIRQADELFGKEMTVDELEVLRVQVEFIDFYIENYRWSFWGLRKNYMLYERMSRELLYKKIVAKICDLRGGVMIYTETGEYVDFGQELK